MLSRASLELLCSALSSPPSANDEMFSLRLCVKAGRTPKANHGKSLFNNDMNVYLVSVVCPYSGIDLGWAQDVSRTRRRRKGVKHLAETLIGRQSAVSRARITIRVSHV